MIRRPPRSTLDRSSAASDVYKRQAYDNMERFFPAKKIVFTGNPVRENLTTKLNDKTEALEYFGLSGNERVVPVSYTHLRAHETVLDLVCRLMLEKKKKKKKNTTREEH